MKKVLVILEIFVIILFLMIIGLSYFIYKNNNRIKESNNSIKNENFELKEKISNMEKTIKQLKHNDESNNKYYIGCSIPHDLTFDEKTSGNEIVKYNNDYYVIIKMGKKSTGGYDIKVIDVDITENDVNIYVKETKPSSGEIVTDAFTYPYDIVRFNFKPNINVIYK